MSTPNQTLCVICRVKPRHGGFPFCGKTCASKATTLCGNCWTKPKFPPFEYCGKKCAAAANAKSGISNANVQTQVLPGVAGIQSMTNTAPNSNNYTKILPTRPFTQGPPPAVQPSPLPLPPPAPNAAKHPAVPSAPANTATSVLQSVKQAFSGTAQQPQAPPTKNQTFVPPRSLLPQTKGGATLICLIPGCGKSVHLDENGLPASDYCSQRHREQAVNSGMVEPCIMCLSLPQGDMDHFCSRLCRDEALSKPATT